MWGFKSCTVVQRSNDQFVLKTLSLAPVKAVPEIDPTSSVSVRVEGNILKASLTIFTGAQRGTHLIGLYPRQGFIIICDLALLFEGICGSRR